MDQNEIAVYGTLFGTFATAIATIALWKVTTLLAKETKRLADATAQPQVVASITPNQWSTRHLDICVQNTGNATAFDIEVVFDPPLSNGEARGSSFDIPLQKISVLKPEQSLTSYLSDVGDYLEKTFEVRITWVLSPDAKNRQILVYSLNMTEFKDVSYLGSRDPLIQIAQEVKHIRDDWRSVTSGSKRLRIESFDRHDRKVENDLINRRFGRSVGQKDEPNWWERNRERRARFKNQNRRPSSTSLREAGSSK